MSRLLSIVCPDECVPAIYRIEPESLKKKGIRALLIDLDNTLVPWRGYDIPDELKPWLRRLTELGIKACIVSNTRSPRRLEKVASALGLPFATRGMKPRRGGFREALRILGMSPHEAAVIGDQVLTDILGGNRLGAHTVLVAPLSRREFVGTKMSRLIERVLLGMLQKRDMIRRPGIETGGEHSTAMGRQK